MIHLSWLTAVDQLVAGKARVFRLVQDSNEREQHMQAPKEQAGDHAVTIGRSALPPVEGAPTKANS